MGRERGVGQLKIGQRVKVCILKIFRELLIEFGDFKNYLFFCNEKRFILFGKLFKIKKVLKVILWYFC